MGNPDGNKAPIPEKVNRAASLVVDAVLAVHSRLGPGLLESVYEICLVCELQKRRLSVERQVAVPVCYEGIDMEVGFRVDLLVERCLIVELKAVEVILPVHWAQVLTYLRLTGHRLGLLINFHVPLIRDGIRRIAL